MLLAGITLDIIQRQYDTIIEVAVGTLSLEDTYRPYKHRFLLLSKNLHNDCSNKGGETAHPLSAEESPALDHREVGTIAVRSDPFASISVVQIFDPLSPFKRAMNREVNIALRKKTNEGGERDRDRDGEKGDQSILRELDESLLIKTIGLSISVDASSVRQVLDIVGPAFVCIFSSPVQTLDLILSPLENPLPSTDYSTVLMEFENYGVRVSPRGKLIGCLENHRERERLAESDNSGIDQNRVLVGTGTGAKMGAGTGMRSGTGREVVRALLKLDLRVESVTLDMMKVSTIATVAVIAIAIAATVAVTVTAVASVTSIAAAASMQFMECSRTLCSTIFVTVHPC